MSLQVWLPLNGDLHNQGLDNTINITNTGATINNIGKIGQCYEFAANKKLSTPINIEKLNSKSISFACWIYVNSWGSSYDAIMSIASGTSWNSSRAVLCRNNTASTLTWNIGNNSTSKRVNTNTSITLNTWTHIAATYDGQNLKIYLNGTLDNTTTANLGIIYSNTLVIGAWTTNNNYPFNGKINDVRIYDHCLSAKEIEEISKGLVLHYKLDNDGFGNENYWSNGKPLRENSSGLVGELITMFARTNSAYASVPTFTPNKYIETKFLSTRTPIEDGGVQFQKLQRYNETINGMCPILEHLKTGEQFTISYELYVTSPVIARFHLTKVLDGTSTKVQPDINSIQISTLNAWTKVSQSIEIPSSFDESNITTESRLGMYLSICEILGVTSSGEVTIRIRNIKFEKSQVATAWTPARADFGHSNDNIIYDSSGYGNNGSIIGDLTTITLGPRYNCAAHLESSSPTTNNNTGLSYIQTPLQISAPTQITVCWWANPENGYNNSVGHGAWCTSANNEAPLDYNSTAFHHRDNKFDICLNSASTTSLSLAFNNYTKNEWHYYSVVYDGKDAILYKDGVETNRSSISSTIAPLKSFTNLYIGFSKAGGVWRKTLGAYSDFRIYSTALTAEQVKELYNTSTTIDKNGNIYARELVEE